MEPGTTELATLGGGCFWCLDAVFSRLKGVEKVESGYAGGFDPRPTYEAVCDDVTGHAEVVQVTFDPTTLPYRTLLEVFFSIHDPTTEDRQGADVGSQYRSIVLAHSPEQERVVRELVAELERDGGFPGKIVTAVEPFREFFPAEAYHQDYYAKNPAAGYCRAVVAPKVAKLRAKWAPLLRA
ncbi:MAG TPA: peptide-methionine (S)-S-oxide reductase MsrA [Candidatus Thermoplasmatota archaeon]|nr:peptide-methionine (S)-S-oxide reductase MsrA [Candidatus Thermoplasmatota archaeon]